MEDFSQLNLPAKLQSSLDKMGFNKPTPIQAQAIPMALDGKDVLGSAQTGSGKTGAFSIPLVAKILNNPRGSALVLTPTRELAVQVIKVIDELLGFGSPIRSALLIGGDPMPKQLQQLKARPRVIVGTPGRINDHLARGSLMLHDTSFLVLDETDRMLDMGFGIQLEKIFKFLPQQRQTLMFSATLPDAIVKMSEKYLVNPERIAVGESNVAAKEINQEVQYVKEAEKYNILLNELDNRDGSIIIFVKTKFGAERLATKLYREGFSADAIHGDLQQRKRDRVIAEYRDKRFRILVATDIAARGLDIPHIEHVINYDMPQCPEDYIHRIGRTARAGSEGTAVSLVSSEDSRKWKAIQRLMNPDFEREERARSGGGMPSSSEGRKPGRKRYGSNTRNRSKSSELKAA
jgi:superfamily II DNA/RNA helicase